VKAHSAKVTASQLEAKGAFIDREKRRLEDLVTMIQKAQESLDARRKLLDLARIDWRSMQAELLRDPKAEAAEEAAETQMDCTLDELERKELNLYREMGARNGAGDEESAKRLLEDLNEVQSQLKRRRLVPPPPQPTA
jgi:hypothetical protein